MFSHHTLVTGGTFNHTQIKASKGALELLQDATSPAAFHNSGQRRDPPKCHPNTRIAVLNKILDWIFGLDPKSMNSLIMWIHGPAGSGKSAIAQTVADLLFKEKILLASYFFSRFDSTRNHKQSLIPTIAYQVASYLPEARDLICAAIEADPLLFTRSLGAQITSLIIEPLQPFIKSGYFNSPKPARVVIIDGLDECKDRDGQLDILLTISNAFQQCHLPLLLLIASRPEHDITHAFSSGFMREVSSRLALDEDYMPSDDIELFLSDNINDIKKTHPFKSHIPPDWPTAEVIERLVNKSSGQFIYAATVIKFVKSIRHRPTDRLDIILGLRAPARDLPFAELDALYHQIFLAVEDRETVLQILAFDILSKPTRVNRPLSETEAILSLNPGDARLLLCDLHSVVDIRPGEYLPESLHFFHASLEDFLLDESRSKDLYINPPLRHTQIAHKLFYYIRNLERQPATNLDGLDLELLGYHIMKALPNDELRQEILNLDITQFFSRKYVHRFVKTIPHYLNSIKQSQFSDANELYARHLLLFNRYATACLPIYYSDPHLTALLAVAIAVADSRTEVFPHFSRAYTCLFPSTGIQVDKPPPPLHGLRLMAPWGPLFDADYGSLIQKLCMDTTKPEIYFDDKKYAGVALFFLRYICDHSPDKIFQIPATKRRINTPWKWRLTMKWKFQLALSKRIPEQQGSRRWMSCLRLNIRNIRQVWLENIADSEIRGAVLIALWYLSYMLRNAGRSGDLITFARQRCFGLISQVEEKYTRKAKKEIARYLKRMDSSDEQLSILL